MKNFDKSWQYLKLGLPGVLITSMDWGSYEIISLLSGSFGVQAQTSVILVWNLADVICQV